MDMPEALQLTRPVVGSTARLHADQAAWQVRKERCHLVPLELPLQYWHTVFIHTVRLRHVLG